VFQDFRLLEDRTTEENVAFALEVTGARESAIPARVMRVLSQVGLAAKAHAYPRELSGGEQQRVTIARALVNEPTVLLADEPTGNLDERASRGVFQLLRDINASGTAVVMATHNLELVRQTSYRVVELQHGAIVYDSVVDEAGREAADRKQGCVEFRGPSATAGYYRNAAATRRMRDRGWIDSGDLGYIAEGELYVTGRAKDLIIRAGRNIHPQELEEAVGVVPGIRLGFVAVFGMHNARLGTERLVVAAETRATHPEDLEKLVSKIRDLSSELLDAPPDDVVLVPPGGVPRTPSGKVRRSACRALYEKGELRRKRRSAGLQMARLALSSLGPGLARTARAAGRVFYAAWSWGTVFAFGVPLWLALAAIPGTLFAAPPPVFRPSLAPSRRHPCVRRGTVEHPRRTPFRARPQPCELPRFLRPSRGTSAAFYFPGQEGVRPQRCFVSLPPPPWHSLRRAHRRRTERPGCRGHH
jgi:energy-coupling factor transporter ATP-binding protein EcfA2